jgi:hypothetical protein
MNRNHAAAPAFVLALSLLTLPRASAGSSERTQSIRDLSMRA